MGSGLFDRIAPEKRERILHAAIKEFSSLGFSAANTNTIAKKAGISVGSLFKYFETKEDLYLILVHYAADTLEQTLKPVLESDKDVLEKVDSIIALILENPAPELTLMYQRFTVEADELLAYKVAERIESVTASAYANLIKQAQRDGLVTDEVGATVLAFCIDNIFLALQFSRCSAYYRRRMELYLGDGARQDADTFRKEIMAFLRRALCR